MWLYDYMQRNKVLIFSIYSIFMVLGSLSFWRMLQGNSHQHVLNYLGPVFLSLVIVMLLLLLCRRDRRIFLRFLSILSVLVITPLFFELSGVDVTLEEMSVSFFYLLTISSSITIFLSENHALMKKAVRKSLFFSILFFIIFLVSQLFAPEWPYLILILIVGQMVSYLVFIMFITLKSDKKVSQNEIFSKQGNQDQSEEFPWASFRVFLYIAGIMVSFYFVVQEIDHYSWMLSWFISLFLLSAISNSYRKSIVVHILLLTLFVVIWIGFILYSKVLIDTWPMTQGELASLILTAIFLIWGIGLQPILIAILSRYTRRKTYIIAGTCFVLPLVPMLFGGGFDAKVKFLTLVFVIGSLIVSVATFSLYSLFNSILFRKKMRAARPYILAQRTQEPEEPQEKKESTMESQLQERELTYLYREWLYRRELQLEIDPTSAKVNDNGEQKKSNMDD